MSAADRLALVDRCVRAELRRWSADAAQAMPTAFARCVRRRFASALSEMRP